MKNKPPFQITPLILTLSGAIERELGALAGFQLHVLPVKLRRRNTIKTVQSSLAIEGNTLSFEQVSDVFEGKRVIGPRKDILEVRNALKVYSQLPDFDPLSLTDFKKAHALLMHGLVEHSGVWRKGGVAVYKGDEVAHVAPPAKVVPQLMDQLFEFIKKDTTLSWILKACIFHYELEFIHPFVDGNGRMGRLWQQRLLMKASPIFEFVAVESLIRDHQEQYYAALAASDQMAESTVFIEFCLEHILKALQLYGESARPAVQDFRSRLGSFKDTFSGIWFSRKDYLAFYKDISPATASRDLLHGVQEGILRRRGEKNQVTYCFV